MIIPGSHSLKEKRQVLSGLMNRMNQRFNVSVCEVEGQDTWQRSRLEVALVATSETAVREGFAAILRSLEENLEITIFSSTLEVL